MNQGPATGSGAGEENPSRNARVPGGNGEFGYGGLLNTIAPSGHMGLVLEHVAGTDRSYAALTDDELTGVLTRWAAQEAWCTAGKLAVVRALIRRHPEGTASRKGALPRAWNRFLPDEIASELRISVNAADSLIQIAWVLEVRLPKTAAALDNGLIDFIKARIIVEATSVLDDQQAAKAEDLIAERLPEMTPGQLGQAIGRAVVKVDPKGAQKRREEAQQERARVTFWREHAGTAALAGLGLPPDEALAADQHIQNRALAYKQAGIPGRMDLLRVRAFIDLLTEKDSRDLIPEGGWRADDAGDVPAGNGDQADDAAPQGQASQEGDEEPGEGEQGDNGGDGDGGDGGSGPSGSQPGNSGGGASAPTGERAPVTAKINLTIPLATLLGLADHPAEAPGWGAIDPALARDLAARAGRSDGTTWCVTVTDSEGVAIAHGCAKAPRKNRTNAANQTRAGPAFAQADGRGPPGGYGTWTLWPSGGTGPLTIQLHGIPVTDCDHSYECTGHDPSDLLRHLVEIRDGTCTYPPCAQPARRCDFEHAIPFEQGGKTCGCNGGMRHRRHHLLKQSPGWTVTQPQPGWHQWQAPSGRIYTQGPKRYPI